MHVPEYATRSAEAWARWMYRTHGVTASSVAVVYGQELFEEWSSGARTEVTTVEYAR